MKSTYSILKKVSVSLMFVSLLIGCSTVKGIFGKASTKTEKSAQQITLSQNEIDQNKDEQLSHISDFSFATDYALRRSTNRNEPAIGVAAELNTRTLNIAGLPSFDDQKTMSTLVDDLLDPSLVAKGNMLLQQKDNEIISLQSQNKYLQSNRDKAIADFVKLSQATALQTDTLSSKLASYTSYWGLGGVVLGLWSFGVHIFWALLICIILYIILRGLSMTNPVAASVFSIFTRVGSLLIQFVEYIAPKSIEELELVSSEAYTALEKEYNTLKNSIISAAVTPVASSVTYTTSSVSPITIVVNSPISGSSGGSSNSSNSASISSSGH